MLSVAPTSWGPPRWSGACSCLRHTPLQREQSLRALLDEDDDEDEHHDLRDHGARPGLEELVRESEPERRVDGAGELSDAAEHDHHERIDDVRLAEVGPDVADLRERTSGKPGDSRAQAEGPRIDARRWNADAGSHRAVLRDAADKEPETRTREEERHAREHGTGERDDDDAAPRKHDAGEDLDA